MHYPLFGAKTTFARLLKFDKVCPKQVQKGKREYKKICCPF